MLAAGTGRRLGLADGRPKSLLRFGDESLLARHLRLLAHCGIERVDICVGYRAEAIRAELARLGATDQVTTHDNPDYRRGPIVSLWALREVLRAGETVIFLDADVLYDYRMLERLVGADAEGCYLMDHALDPGEDPVRLCLRDGRLVDIHKVPERAHDTTGEWTGLARFAPGLADAIATAAERRVAAGAVNDIYEQAFRDVLFTSAPGRFTVVDVSDLPWIEIDYPEDLRKAREEVFPRLVEAESRS